MAIAATAVLLLLAAVGGGIDMSRAYMAKTNLQSACDAGVLAGRKAMAASGEYTNAEKAKANKMFNFNAKLSATDSTLVSFDSTADDEGAVNGEASIAMPTVIMKMFGFKDFDLSVQCSAELQMASADVIFVLDTTGSMAGSKIQSLRNAVKEFHKTVAAAVIDKEQTRIRYAFVPYSMTVNVSGLASSGAMEAGWFANEGSYQTRLAKFDQKDYKITEESVQNTDYVTKSFRNESDCTDWANENPKSISGTPPAQSKMILYSFEDWSKGRNDRNGTCERKEKTVTRKYDPTPVYRFTGWDYAEKSDFLTSGFASGVSLATNVSTDATVPTKGKYDIRTLAGISGATGVTVSTSNWSGCLEERRTVVNLNMNPVPTDAYDLNINDEPTSDATRWKPYWADVEYNRSGSRATENCPAPIRQFEEVDTADATEVPDWLDDYLDSLVAKGNTYHDIGMIWGARIGSTRGMFTDNVNEGDNLSVSRHIIFMTDGAMEPSTSGYSAYGIENLDHRIAPSGTSSSRLIDYHNSRFLAACRAAEAEGYTVWVIAFGTSITSQMLNCSTGERAYYASDATELNNTFRFIAGQVADLRINK